MHWNVNWTWRLAFVLPSLLPILCSLAIGMVLLGSTLEISIAQDPQPDDEKPPANTERRSVDEMIEDLLEDDPAAPVAPNLDQAGELEAMETNKLVPENTVFARRQGRVVRADNGAEWLFVFDADTSGESDPPMVLMPCRTLERAERIAEEQGDAARFVVSGRIYVYHGRNYLLPTVMRLTRDQDNLSP